MHRKIHPRRRRPSPRLLAHALLGAAIWARCMSPAAAQSQTPAGTVEHIKVHAPSLEGNLQGNTTDRDVVVYLPPTYASEPSRRYPVVYQLHGWLPSAEQWAGMIALGQSADRAIGSGAAKEMIVVLPDALTVHEGSMYSTSIATGDFESFVAHDLVDYVDEHYRTLATRSSRGLSGHSMGGYGTLRIGMKHPQIYSSIYAMSSCCLEPYRLDGAGLLEASKITTLEQANAAGIGTRVALSLAAAWSPNPHRPPLYFDFPLENGEPRPAILAKWDANTPLAMIDQYIPSLRRFDAIGLEVGRADGLLEANTRLHQVLDSYAVAHQFETYDGNHTNRVAERFETRVLPFFSKVLDFD